MSKELEAFRGFKNGMITDNAICITKSYFDNKFPIIESALQRLDAIDNANPSEVLKQLGDISYFIMEAYSDHEPLKENQRDSKQCFMNYCSNIKQALLKAQEQEKVLEIIKKKTDLSALIDAKNVDDFNWYLCCEDKEHEFTQEEFELLKQYFEKKYSKVIVKEWKNE